VETKQVAIQKNGEALKVFAGGEELCGGLPTVADAVDIVVSATFLFNLKYGENVKRNAQFVAEVVCGLPCEAPLPVKTTRLANKMVALTAAEASGEE